MHAQAEPERPKGEGHGWPEFYSPQMRGKWWSDIEFSLSRLSTAQTPCLARTSLARRSLVLIRPAVAAAWPRPDRAMVRRQHENHQITCPARHSHS